MTLLTAAQAADILGMSRRGVAKLVSAGTLPAQRHGQAFAFRPSDG